jgi:hypothetical protein
MHIRTAMLLALVAGSAAVISTSFSLAQQRAVKVEATDSAEAEGKSMAILIGVQDYASLPKLKYARADVALLARTLRDTCNFDKVILMTEDAIEPRNRPTLGNISARLRQ